MTTTAVNRFKFLLVNFYSKVIAAIALLSLLTRLQLAFVRDTQPFGNVQNILLHTLEHHFFQLSSEVLDNLCQFMQKQTEKGTPWTLMLSAGIDNKILHLR